MTPTQPVLGPAPPGKARLTIKSVPSRARIYINGEDTGVYTPGTVDIDMD